MICSKPICFFGQPSARANGSHIAITSGVRTIDGLSSGASGRSASKLSSRPQSEDAGDHATGLQAPVGDLRLGLAGGDDLALDEDRPCRRPARRCSLKRRISGASSFSFSGE